MQDLREKLPPGERNALLILFSQENQKLKAQIVNQEQTIVKLSSQVKSLEEKISEFRQNAGYKI